MKRAIWVIRDYIDINEIWYCLGENFEKNWILYQESYSTSKVFKPYFLLFDLDDSFSLIVLSRGVFMSSSSFERVLVELDF